MNICLAVRMDSLVLENNLLKDQQRHKPGIRVIQIYPFQSHNMLVCPNGPSICYGIFLGTLTHLPLAYPMCFVPLHLAEMTVNIEPHIELSCI